MAQKKLTKKGEAMETQRLVAVISKDLYKRFKKEAVEREKDMKDLLAEVLEDFLKKGKA
jgi:hypothetical protein